MSLFGKKRPLLPPEDQSLIVQAIQEAERTTSGEVRVFMESRCSYVDAMDRAREVFYKLKMEETKGRNGALIYVALTDHQLAIFGDEGIFAKTGGPAFWVHVLDDMRVFFKEERYAEGIRFGVLAIGKALSEYFPYEGDADKNELPDEIVFGH